MLLFSFVRQELPRTEVQIIFMFVSGMAWRWRVQSTAWSWYSQVTASYLWLWSRIHQIGEKGILGKNQAGGKFEGLEVKTPVHQEQRGTEAMRVASLELLDVSRVSCRQVDQFRAAWDPVICRDNEAFSLTSETGVSWKSGILAGRGDSNCF